MNTCSKSRNNFKIHSKKELTDSFEDVKTIISCESSEEEDIT